MREVMPSLDTQFPPLIPHFPSSSSSPLPPATCEPFSTLLEASISPFSPYTRSSNMNQTAQNKTALARFAAPLLLALAASATTTDYDYPTSTPLTTASEGEAAPTLYPRPTVYYERTPAPAEEEEVGIPVEEEEMSMDAPADGEMCSTYAEDVRRQENSSVCACVCVCVCVRCFELKFKPRTSVVVTALGVGSFFVCPPR